MPLHDIYFVDIGIIYQIFLKNIWYMVKLFIMAYIVYYWIPIKVFPQEYTGKGIQKIIFNFIYMIAYAETVIPFLVLIKAFSILLFIFTLIATKLVILKLHYKREIIPILGNFRINAMMWFFNLLDKTKEIKNNGVKYFGFKIIKFYKVLTAYRFFKYLLFVTIFIYIISILMARGMSSYSNPIPDTAQFIDWVVSLQDNILYSDSRSAGADFYGQAVSIFLVSIFTNIDPIILFSLYPVLLLVILYFSIYYVVKDVSQSQYVAIIAVAIHGIVLMSPLSDMILGKIVIIKNSPIVDFYGLKVYIPTAIEIAKKSISNGNVPYLRYISALAYEHSSVFVLLNSYFLIKTLQTHLDRYLIPYTLTLMLVFTFHGGGAIVLVVISIFIAINAMIFRKIDKSILKKGLLGVFVASIIGNLWMLSVIKYGIPQDFGAAAPFLDKLLGTQRNLRNIATTGVSTLAISDITTLHIIMIIMILFAYIFALFTKKRFIYSSFVLIISSIFLVYFAPNIGLPLLAKQSRLSEYMFFAITFLFSFYYFYFLYKPTFYIFKRYAKYIILLVSYTIFISLVLIVPRWMDTHFFWKNLNAIEYSSISNVILKIDDNNRPFDWTVVSYVQEYAKVRDKGYHINTQKFLLRYNPAMKELNILTSKIYIFVENFPNSYKGKEEWYYRWRGDIQNSLKTWIAIYSATHSNIRIYYKTKTITVYEIDNSGYVNCIKRLKRLKNGHF